MLGKKKILMSFLCTTLLIVGISLNAFAIPMPNSGALVGVFSGNDNDYDYIESLLESYSGLDLDGLLYGKIDEGDGIGSTTEGSLSITTEDLTGDDPYQWGSWSSDVSLIGYSLKGSDKFALYYLDPNSGPWTSGYWNMYDVLNNGDQNPTLSHFTGYAPIPEPATMLLLGSGLLGLAAFRRKFRKR